MRDDELTHRAAGHTFHSAMAIKRAMDEYTDHGSIGERLRKFVKDHGFPKPSYPSFLREKLTALDWVAWNFAMPERPLRSEQLGILGLPDTMKSLIAMFLGKCSRTWYAQGRPGKTTYREQKTHMTFGSLTNSQIFHSPLLNERTMLRFLDGQETPFTRSARNSLLCENEECPRHSNIQ